VTTLEVLLSGHSLGSGVIGNTADSDSVFRGSSPLSPALTSGSASFMESPARLFCFAPLLHTDLVSGHLGATGTVAIASRPHRLVA
jgi:hypothetical protein